MATTVETNDSTQYGNVWNGGTFFGITVGSGYDVMVKRETETSALALITEVRTKREWLSAIGVESDSDLMREAARIAQCPSAELGGMPSEDDWDMLADRWDAIKVRAKQTAEPLREMDGQV